MAYCNRKYHQRWKVVRKMNKREIESWLKSMCNRYNLDYEKHKKELWDMLNEKVKATGEGITDNDTKEVCKMMAYDSQSASPRPSKKEVKS